MAEGILKHLVSLKELQGNVRVISSGVAAIDSHEASSLAQEVCRDAGIDISTHSSQPLTKNVLKQCDLVLVMTQSHRHEIERVFPVYSEITYLLKEYGRAVGRFADLEVEDPYGGSREDYIACFDELYGEIERILPVIEKEIADS
jgi:protein-tyrosine phosphatase